MKDDVVVPVLASAVGLLGALLIALALFWVIKACRKLIAQKYESVPVEMKPRRFSYEEVVKMTHNFHRVIGGGGFGSVYQGQINGVPVAVKVHRGARLPQSQNEVIYLSKVHHKNLINLIGYYEDSTTWAVVYEFIANGDLKNNLTGSASTKLSWERRLGIAIGLGKALDYLHDGCQPPLIHRDIKSAHILLCDNFEVKLCGFDLAVTLTPSHHAESHVFIDVVGSSQYIDPQYCVSGKLTKGSDVYGFGVVLMEIVTGKQAGPIGVDGEYVSLTQWVSSMFGKAQVGSMVDPRLEGNYDVCSVEEALKIAMACSSQNTHDRPTMGEVVIKLEHCLQMETARFNQTISGGYT